MDSTNFIDVRKSEALALYYSGKSKSSIRKELSIRNRLLKKWIDEDTKTIKEKALHMYCHGFSVNKICKCIFVDKTHLYNWIKEMQRDIAFNVIENDLNEITKLSRVQNGYSKWIDNTLGI
jgi:transposase-like protein